MTTKQVKKAEDRGPEIVKLIQAHETSKRLVGEHKAVVCQLV